MTPPRLLAEQQQQEQLSKAFFRSARAYWLQHEDGGAGESGAAAAGLDSSQMNGKLASQHGYKQTLQKFLAQQGAGADRAAAVKVGLLFTLLQSIDQNVTFDH